MTDESTVADQAKVIHSFVRVLEQERHSVQLFETHISWIVVAGKGAYKFKKAVHFDFLDFSTLDARHFYCQEELRLNRRLAPDLYLDVVAITGSPMHPVIDGPGAPIEYAVRMRAFSQHALWSARIEKNRLGAPEIDALAKKLAQFHQNVAVASNESLWSTPATIQKIAEENLAVIAELVVNEQNKKYVDDLRIWQTAQHLELRHLFEKRKAQGFVRECHGDLHSGNILTLNNQVAIFDCIEFNESLRWIDVMNDLAFICMDLQFHGLHGLAIRLRNAYLEMTGDYDGVAVLRYYQTQRALVRCKIALLRAAQFKKEGKAAAASQAVLAAKYLTFSLRCIESRSSAVIITHGYSGSGKSTVSKCLAELIDAVQIRSDVERKRMHGIASTSNAAMAVGAGLYDPATTQATYERLRKLAHSVVQSGMPVIVDAAFLKKEQRHLFQHLADELGVPFFITDIQADATMLQTRIAARAQLGQDPSDAGLEVLAHQLAHHDALTDDEKKHVLCIDSAAGLDMEKVRQMCEPIVTVLRNAT